MVSVIELNDKVPRITRGNDFVLGVHLVENRVVGYRRIEQREIEGEVTISEVKLVTADKRRTILSEGEAVNGSNTWHLNSGNNVIINFYDKLPIGRYGIEIIFTVGGLDKRFYLEPGTCFNVVESSPDGFVPAENVMTYQADANTGLGTLVDMSDYYTKGQMDDALQKVEQSVGYFECSTAGGTAAKTVTAPSYALRTGGSMKIKMTNGNTASNPTININATGAKPIYYNGAIASPTNSWEAGEVIEVYYDGTNYQATNFQGGGSFSTGEKVGEVGITDEATQDSEYLITSGAVYSMMNAISSGAGVSLTPVPTLIYKNTPTNITLTAKMNNASGTFTLEILDGNNQLNTGTSSPLTHSVANLSISGNSKQYTVKGTYLGMVFTASATIQARNPIYVGMGASAAAVAVDGNKMKALSAIGTYSKTANADNQKFYLIVPSDVTPPTKFSMGGAPFAITKATNQTINGISGYTVFASGGTYDAGTTLDIEAK